MEAAKLETLPMEKIVDYALGFIPDSGVIDDFEHLLDKIEEAFDLDLGTSMLSPEIKAIRRAIRAGIRERQ